MIRILTYSGSHSVKNLGFPTSVYLNGRIEDYINDVVIRWGSNSLLTDRRGNCVEFRNVLNPSRAVSLNMNKIKAHEVLSHVVRVPRMFRRYTPDRGLFVVRPCVHEGGSGFKVLEAKGQPIRLNEGYEYATDFIRTDCEYRVWFVGNRTLRARRERTPEQRQNNREFPKFPCRSKWGYVFRNSVPQSLHNATIMAAKEIGLDCGAADVILGGDDCWYFLELNSAPSCDLPLLNRWMKESINILARNKFGRLLY